MAANSVEGVDVRGARGCAAFNLRKTARVVTQVYDDALRDGGLRSTQFTVLMAIARSEEPTVGMLAELTMMDSTTMTRNLRLMAKDGLVEVSARGPGREKLVSLTHKGTRTLARAVPLWRAAQARFEAAFGARRWSELRRELDQVAAIAVASS
ncbi:MAG: MarR family winged helix-turn-helix transcriptional regulator [Alphaproteobacteria bacterium]|nr:MarR family winged helix-turn-helix transcriptional regulator [Alphaproteobacteria bacterium]